MTSALLILGLYLVGVGCAYCIGGFIQGYRNREHRYLYYAEVFDGNQVIGRAGGIIRFGRTMNIEKLNHLIFDGWKETLTKDQLDLMNAVLLIKSLTRL